MQYAWNLIPISIQKLKGAKCVQAVVVPLKIPRQQANKIETINLNVFHPS